MIRIGLVDLDTSHPAFFTNLLHRSPDMRVTAIYDGGAVQSSEYIAQFAHEHGIPQICNSLDELVAQVDGGMVLSQNWDVHLERARPFLLAGKPVFIDKPMVGRLSDLNALLALAKQTGTPVMGGSTMRFAAELGALRDKVADLGGVVSAFASGPGDLLNFGAHVVEMITAFFGAQITTVSHIGGTPSHLFRLDQRDGPPIILQLGGGQNGPGNGCVLVLTTQRSVEVIHPQGAWQMTDATLQALSHFFREGIAPLPLAASLQVVQICLAAAQSRHHGVPVALSAIHPNAGFDGAAYTRDYAKLGAWQHDGLSARSHYIKS